MLLGNSCRGLLKMNWPHPLFSQFGSRNPAAQSKQHGPAMADAMTGPIV